ncbi:MAG: CHAT domain-containing protein [Candidatus Latescibacterota bacterium]|nr:MAG: CHAT domain-containing protein [Candidatus Latescibacterota bacterium]
MRLAPRAVSLVLGVFGAWLVGGIILPRAEVRGQADTPAGALSSVTPADSLLSHVIETTDSLRRAGAGDSALALLEPILAELESAADSLRFARLLAHKGRMLRRLGRAREAEPILRAAVARAEANRDSLLLCDALLQLGNTLDALGRDPRAIPVYQRLIAAAEASGDTANVARAHLYLGRRAQASGDVEQARQRLQAAHSTFQRLGLEGDELISAFMLAVVRARSGDLAGARAMWLETSEMARRLEDQIMEAGSLTNLGRVESAVGDPGVAVQLWLRAEALYRHEGRFQAAVHATVNAANALALLGRYGFADSLLDAQLHVARDQGYRDLEVDLIMAWGGMEKRRGQNGVAAELYREALSLLGDMDLVERELNALLGLSAAVAARGSTEAALRLLQRQAEPLRQRVSPQNQIELDLHTARHELALERATTALRRLVRVERLAQRGRYLRYRIEALPMSAEAYESLGQADSALVCLQRAARIWEAERSVPRDAEWREQRGALAARVFTQTADLALRHPTSEPEEERTRAAFELLQRFKARTLLERMTGPSATGDSLLQVPAPVRLARLQDAVLRDDEILLDAFVGPEVSFLFAVTRERCRAQRLPGLASGLGSKIELWAQLLTTPPARTVDLPGRAPEAPMNATTRASLGHLRELLFAGIADLLAGKTRVIFAPDGALNRLALSALVTPVDGYEVVRVPSATALTLVRLRDGASPRPRTQRVLAMAGTTTPDGADLAGAAREVRALAARFKHVEARIVGAPQPISERELSEFDVLHLAAHTTVDDQQPWRSGILLAGAGDSALRSDAAAAAPPSLRAARISEMRLSARLAVLSGCESAHGRLLSGEGGLGLTSAFLSAGVPAVVATLWPVDDAMTAHLMARLYDHLGRGATAAAALRSAQLDLQRSARTSHPFYWAGFVLVGNGDLSVELQLRASWRQRVAAAVGLMLALGAAWSVWRWRRGARPAWMVPAAAALVALLLIYGPGEESAVRSGILRGDSATEFAASAQLEPGVPATRFTWSAVGGADAYDVVLLSVDLEEVARHPAGTETSLQLAFDRVRHDNSGLLWRVQAYRRGDALRNSRIAPLPLPAPARD